MGLLPLAPCGLCPVHSYATHCFWPAMGSRALGEREGLRAYRKKSAHGSWRAYIRIVPAIKQATQTRGYGGPAGVCARWSILTGTGSRLNGSEDTPYFLIKHNEWRLSLWKASRRLPHSERRGARALRRARKARRRSNPRRSSTIVGRCEKPTNSKGDWASITASATFGHSA